VPVRGVARLAMTARGPWHPGIRFAPEMIAPELRSCRTFHSKVKPMTAYLISLALIGLIAIAVWEEPS
jgi:hypothetical protein